MTEQSNPEVAILNGALELPLADRAAYLDRACAGDAALREQVEALLQAHDQAEDFLNAPPAGLDFNRTARVNIPLTEKSGDKIGRYKLLQQIGEGGCGVVYMAEQEEPVRRRVALKVIKLGMDTKQVIARFEAERQALAMMDHPNIAKVLDAGATETGRPYFVMELVRGIKITDFCDENKLSTADRLKLFIQVCQAIQHAHQKGVIHRDIKPSNILVTVNDPDSAGCPKVIDFGIAKATAGRLTDQTLFTAFEQFIGTPAYMSPEQAVMTALDIDTRSDIYSLGVLLYELLTGKTPFDAQALLAKGLDEMRRTIREVEPVKPSTRLTQELVAAGRDAFHRVPNIHAKNRDTVERVPPNDDLKQLIHALRGDLDWIAMKCLEKDRARRYETANGLARDIERHLNCEPVVARPPSKLYEFQKTVGRHKFGFAAAAALITVLAAGVLVSTLQAVRATRAEREQTRHRQIAEAKEKKSEQVAQFLKDMLDGVGPSKALGRDATMLREILDKTAERVGKDLTNQPEVEAELRYTLGEVYWDLGDVEKAEAMHRQALEIRRRVFGSGNREVIRSTRRLAIMLARLGQFADAQALASDAVAAQRRLGGSKDLDLALSLNDLSAVLTSAGTTAPAQTALREALDIQRHLLGDTNLDVVQTLDNLSAAIWNQGNDRDEALRVAHQALDIRTALQGSDHPQVRAASLSLRGTELLRQDKPEEAEVAFKEEVALRRKLLGNEHPDLAQALNKLASVLEPQGKPSEAEALRHEALQIQRKSLGDYNEEVAGSLRDLGRLFEREGKLAEAESVYRETLSIRTNAFGDQSGKLASMSLVSLGNVLFLERKLPEAESVLRESVAIRRELGSSGWAGEPLLALGKVLWAQGRTAEALAAYGEAEDSGNAWIQFDLGNLYRSGEMVLQDKSAAVRLYRKSAEQNNKWAQVALADMYRDGEGVQQDKSMAARWYQKAAEQNHKWAQSALGDLYRQGEGVQQDFAEAAKWYQRGAELNNEWAQYRLGQMYQRGQGVAADPVEAAKWCRKAAEQGLVFAQMVIAGMYARGEGVAIDATEAAKWYGKAKVAAEKAARSGDEQALNAYAWLLATCDFPEIRDGTNAIRYAEGAVAKSSRNNPGFLDTLAAAYAEVGDFAKAVSLEREAMALLKAESSNTDFAARLKLYESKTPYRDR